MNTTLRRKLLLGSGQMAKPYPQACASSPNLKTYQRQLAEFGAARASATRNLTARAHGATSSQCRAYAEMLLQCGELDGALSLARKAVDKDGDNAAAWDTLGSVLVQKSQLDEACACYAKSLQLEPDLLSAANNIAIALERLGKLREAEAHYGRLLAKAPDNLEIKTNFAALLGKLGQYHQALQITREVLGRDPHMARACILTSTLLTTLGRYPESLIFIDRAIAIAPAQVTLHTRRADILRQLGRADEALAACDEVLGKLPHDPEALHERALVLRSLDKPQQALEGLRLAQAANPASAMLAADRGWLLAELGRKEDAINAFDEALKLREDLGAAWYGRSLLVTRKAGDADLQTMERILADKELIHHDRIQLSFALGKSYLDVGDGEKAFAHLGTGNGLKRSAFHYDPRCDASHLQKMTARFPAGSLTQAMRADPVPGGPIFVFGMPRSGTTLIEQMLCSHALVGTIGESPAIGNLANKICDGRASDAVRKNKDQWRSRYLERARAETSGKLFFVDKTPSNFLHLGLIFLLLPEARLIHCRRDPFDTCLSCYATLFTSGHEYSYDLSELGQYYAFYRQQMAYWRAALPANTILDVNYEILVEDTESQVRRIVEFCGLNFDANCLRFYEMERHVKTASFNQVRSPIYKTSVKRSEAFGHWLGPLQTVLMNGPPTWR